MRLRIGRARESVNVQHGRVEIYLEPRDLWIGLFVAKNAVYICPVPVLVIRVSRGAKS